VVSTLVDRVVVGILPHVPRPIVRRVAMRYVAGAKLDDALRTIAALNRAGAQATTDVLGEFIHELTEADRACELYMSLIEAIHTNQLDSQVSVKLTALGLLLEPEACYANVRRVVGAAAARGNLVTIDMEDSNCTDATLRLFQRVRSEFSNVGAVLQACLKRSRADLERVLPVAPNIRVCKGIYLEPVAIAYQDRDEVRRNFLSLVDLMLQHPSFVGIATHDEALVKECLELLRRRQPGPGRYEFQMLLGVREDLRARLLAAGHPVRVYVPFGEHWYAYSMRRLKENPAVAGHVLRNLLERH
jgi:proline dehydrogenase